MLEEILKELVEAVKDNTAAMVSRNELLANVVTTTHAIGDVSKTVIATRPRPSVDGTETPPAGETSTPAEPEKIPRKKRRTKKQIAEDAAKLGALGDAPTTLVTPATETPPPPATPQTAVEQVAAMDEDDLVGGIPEVDRTHSHPPSATMATPTIEAVRDFAINAGLNKGALEVTKIIALYGENIDAIKPEHYERFMFDVAGLPDVGATPPPPGTQV